MREAGRFSSRAVARRCFVSAVLALALVDAAAAADAIEAADAKTLADAHFEQMYGFDALEAYQSRRGLLRTTFVVARGWREGRAKILIDIDAPVSFSKWALLILHNRDRSDDLFAYVPFWRRVLRLSAIQMESQVLFDVLPLGELRPIVPGELGYSRAPDEQVQGEHCYVVKGRPLHRGLGFDQIELAISANSGFALRTRYFSGAKETRRVLISPADVVDFGGRRLPVRRRIVTPPTAGVTELTLVNLLLDPELPDRLFTTHNLRVQRFPSF